MARVARDPQLTQRFSAQFATCKQYAGRWEKSTDQGQTWEHDFNIDYVRERA